MGTIPQIQTFVSGIWVHLQFPLTIAQSVEPAKTQLGKYKSHASGTHLVAGVPATEVLSTWELHAVDGP
jgi:hypothetical protein